MSIKEMWNYLIFQTKGYRQLGAAIVAGAVCGAGISYINSILYARIIDTLLLEQYTTAVRYVWIMILAVLVVRMVYIMCNQIFEQYASQAAMRPKDGQQRRHFHWSLRRLKRRKIRLPSGEPEAERMGLAILKHSWTPFINFLQNVSKFCLRSCFFLY